MSTDDRKSGLPDFYWSKHTKTGKNITNDHKKYQLAIKYKKWPQTTPKGHKIYQHFPFRGTPKCTQIGLFGLKVNHLATLIKIGS
jgi:hypothetical protein